MPVPQVELGRLAVKYGCHSLNDISDGLASESNEIAAASHVDLILDKSQIPLSDELRRWCEDYELVLTMAPDDFYLLKEAFSSLMVIGRVQAGSGNVYLEDGHHTKVLAPSGWNHFSGGE